MSVRSFQELLLLFLDKHDDFGNKNEEFYSVTINKILTTINDTPPQLFVVGIQTGDI